MHSPGKRGKGLRGHQDKSFSPRPETHYGEVGFGLG